MAKLAIKGHETRGKEVIEILEMLGGKNTHNSWGVFENRIYTIDEKTDEIIDVSERHYSDYNLFTLEEFLEKFPYKVGDKVLINDDENDVYTVKSMMWNEEFNRVAYRIEAVDGIMDDYNTWFAHEMHVAVSFNTKKEETVEEKKINQMSLANCDLDKVEIVLGDNFEMRFINEKWYAIRKKPKYPKTYEECCEVLYLGEDGRLYTKGYKASLIQEFQKLLICRDAYWKIAGEQMGLGKPWEPNWLNVEQDKFVLYTHNNVICSNRFMLGHNVLAFPAAEMRDAFYENFKDLIENCKKLL